MDIDRIRLIYMAVAEAVDVFRVLPRALVALYCYLLYKVVNWYMNLHPVMIEGCKSDTVLQCLEQAPTTQHAVLVTATVGVAAAIFGLYSSTGKKWNGFTYWMKKRPKDEEDEDKSESPTEHRGE